VRMELGHMGLRAARGAGETPDHLTGVQVNTALATPRRGHTVKELRCALDEQQFVLHYQPKVNSRDGRIVGLEALIRWNHPRQGVIYPAHFIPLLEECGLIIAVGRWVLKQAATDYCSWMHQGITPPRIAVNVSPHQLRHKDFIADLERVLRINNVGHAGLDIEITENVLMTDLEDCIEKLTSVRELGVRVAIDDFGTGYSSLRYLARLPVDTLKVDQSFVSMVTESPNDLAIVSGIIVLAHGLNLDVVAEGVETAEQHKFLRLLRCDQMQGYLFSKPIAKAMIEQILKSGANIAAQAHVASDSQSNRTVSEPEFCERRLAAQETWKPA
jgi:EAL domain-containing protein (putative c-di-GMP-specific phosphodiesterase class I)